MRPRLMPADRGLEKPEQALCFLGASGAGLQRLQRIEPPFPEVNQILLKCVGGAVSPSLQQPRKPRECGRYFRLLREAPPKSWAALRFHMGEGQLEDTLLYPARIKHHVYVRWIRDVIAVVRVEHDVAGPDLHDVHTPG